MCKIIVLDDVIDLYEKWSGMVFNGGEAVFCKGGYLRGCLDSVEVLFPDFNRHDVKGLKLRVRSLEDPICNSIFYKGIWIGSKHYHPNTGEQL